MYRQMKRRQHSQLVFREDTMQGQIIGEQVQAVQYFLQGLAYFEENVLPKKQRLIKQLRKIREKKEKQLEEQVFYAITTRKASLEWLNNHIGTMPQEKKITIIVLEYFKDSSITSEYIKAYLDRGKSTKKSVEIISIEFREHDYIVQLEDEYNQSFSYKSLSRYYRKKIQHIALTKLSLMEEEVLEEYYASRYMV